MRHNRRSATSLALSLLLPVSLAVPGRPAGAQDTAVVFLHGINSNGETWNYHADSLSRALRVAPVKPTVDWTQREYDQATQLAGILNGNPLTSHPARRMPFVAHSNGGVASREYRRIGGRLRQIATVATPHRGSLLANNWLNGIVWADGQAFGNALYDPYAFTFRNDPEPPGSLADTWMVVRPIASFVRTMDGLLCPTLGFCLIAPLTNIAMPFVGDVTEGSPVLETLNGGSNIAAEQGAVDSRVGLWSAIASNDAMFYLLTPTPSAWATTRQVAYGWYFHWFTHYRYHHDWFLRTQGAPRWLDGAIALATLDIQWQSWIGALNSWYFQIDLETGAAFSIIDMVPNDGLIINSSAVYPGGTRSAQMPGFLPHTWQLSQTSVTRHLEQALSVDFGIPFRGPAPTLPQPPGYSAIITGPTEMRPGQTCNWMGSSTIVDPTYEWKVGKFLVHTGQELYYSASSNFTLTLVASNSQGHSASASTPVTVSSQSAACAVQ